MTPLRFLPLVVKQVVRHRVRTLLTVSGIAIAMFLFSAVQAMERGVTQATRVTAGETTLVVYRKDRFCPATSVLPQDYQARIERIDGVVSVLPVKIVVSNCRTSLDVVTFRGVPKDEFLAQRSNAIRIVSGSLDDWKRRTDAALIGETLATRRGLEPGMMFDAAGITAYIAGVFRSEEPQDQNVAYTALEFVQLAGRDQLGIVTQFNLRVSDPALLEPVAAEIDDLFRTAQEPTATFSEKAFIGRVATDLVELVSFARWLGLGCLVAVLALIGNAIVLSVQGRVAEHYPSALIAILIVVEGVLLALVGGGLGATAAVVLADVGSFALSVEGQSIPITAGAGLLLSGVLVCAALGVAAGLVPAVQASTRQIAECFRAV
ncbi:MAG: ABC transporter permease [Planctomycetota bacterium]|jgi:putative ABC transport system permease protein